MPKQLSTFDINGRLLLSSAAGTSGQVLTSGGTGTTPTWTTITGGYTLPTATATALGGIELFSATTQTTAANAVTTTASRTYGLQLNSDLQGVVNVPWTDTVYTLPTATASALGGIELFSGTTQTTAANAVTTTASRTYGLQLNADLQGVVNVPWTDTVYTLPAATTTALGGIELFDGTVQSTAANAVSTTASRTYGLQVNAAGQGVINVPWSDTDTNTFPTTWSWSAGTTSGPTASITGTSSTISVAAVPAASDTASGIVTTGAQTFAGVKSMTSPAITTSITTPSSTFNFVTSAGTVNIGSTTPGSFVDVGYDLVVSNNLAVEQQATFGGGYGATGVTISPLGVIQANAAITSDALIQGQNFYTTGSIDVGGGYGFTGATISSTGLISTNSNIVVDGNGTFANLAGTGTRNVNSTSAGILTNSTSSARYKQDIVDAEYVYADILKLQPKTFKLKSEVEELENPVTYAGFIAEDVDEIDSLKVFVGYARTSDGDLIPDSLYYAEMVSALVSAIKHQDARIQALEAQVQALSE
jgi:hypothetical protein